MSITIHPEQINLILYKYLLEMGYNHTAFVFESEAKILPTDPNFRSVPVNYLSQICEQSLLLRSLEIHQGLKDAEECTVDLDLLNPHKCVVSQRRLSERRKRLAEINANVAVRLKEDLRIQAEEKVRKEEERKREEEEQKRVAERLAQLQQFQTHEPAPQSVASFISNYDDHKVIEEDETGGEEIHEVNGDVEREESEVKEIQLPENMKVVQRYNDGFDNYFLLEDRLEGKLRGYVVSEVSHEGLKPLFILPRSLIAKYEDLGVEVQLSKFLILKRKDNNLHFINYRRRELHGSLRLDETEKLKTIEHFPKHGIFALITNSSLKILNDHSLETIKEFKGSFKKVIFKLDRIMLILTEDKKILKRSLDDETIEEEITVEEGEIEDIKLSSNELYFAAKVKNPYSLGIWVNSQNQHLFTFNENNKFEDFIFEGDGENISTYAVCYDQDYMKIWDCDYGCFRQNYDYSRKKLKAILSLKEGEILITLQERGNKVNLINTVSGEEDVLKEVDDDDVDIFKLSETQFGLFEEGKITLVTFN